jgi:hypothetical protein
LADYDYIPINASAERIEKIAQMDINSSVLNDESNDNSLPTSKLVFEELKKSEENNKIVVDTTYNPESESPQSGKAVAEAIVNKMDRFGDVTESGWGVTVSLDNGSKNLEIRTTAAARMVISGGQLILRDDGGGTIFEGMGTLDFQGRALKSIEAPTEATDAATKGYVDNLIITKMDKFGEVTADENGNVTINNNCDLNLKSNNYLVFEGKNGLILKTGLMSISANNIDFLNAHLCNLAEPEDASDAVTKNYVDTQIGDIDAALDEIIALQNSIIDGESV